MRYWQSNKGPATWNVLFLEKFWIRPSLLTWSKAASVSFAYFKQSSAEFFITFNSIGRKSSISSGEPWQHQSEVDQCCRLAASRAFFGIILPPPYVRGKVMFSVVSVCRVPYYRAAVGYTHLQVESPRGIQMSMWPIVTNASVSTQYAKYLRMHSTMCQCAFSSNQAWMLIRTFGLNAESN